MNIGKHENVMSENIPTPNRLKQKHPESKQSHENSSNLSLFKVLSVEPGREEDLSIKSKERRLDNDQQVGLSVPVDPNKKRNKGKSFSQNHEKLNDKPKITKIDESKNKIINNHRQVVFGFTTSLNRLFYFFLQILNNN